MLGGIIAGALGGAGKAASSIADMTMQEQARSRLAQEQALIEEQKMRLADQLARDRASWEVDPKGLGGKKLELARKTGEVETEVMAGRERTLAPIKTENEVDRTKKVKTAEGEVERANAAALGRDQGALAGMQAVADVRESRSLKGSRAATTAGQELENEQRRDAAKTRRKAEQLLSTGKPEDAAQAERLLRGLAVRQGQGKPTEYDTKEVTKSSENPATGEKTTEKWVERRNAPPGSGSGRTAPGSPHPEGTLLTGPDGNLYIVRNGVPVMMKSTADKGPPVVGVSKGRRDEGLVAPYIASPEEMANGR